ncbi:protein kinase [Gemmatimonadota bacterium]
MIGKTISHYKIVDKLGEGGMGAVYKAEDTTLNRLVAIKALSSHLAENDEARERFVREAQAASSLNHSNITTVYELLEDEGEQFIVMEYVDGKTIRDVVESSRVSIRKAVDMLIQAAEALGAAHNKGILHRDVKSANIMVSMEGNVKVMDFGLAHLEDRSQLTRTGTTMGTLAYSSPEQLVGSPVDRRSEIFSLGVVFYELLTGQLPFKSPSEGELVFEIINTEQDMLTTCRDDVPGSVCNVVNKMLIKKPELRYQTCGELISDLKAIQSEMETTTVKISTAGDAARAKKKALTIGITSAVVITGLIAVLMSEGNRSLLNPEYIVVDIIENRTDVPSLTALGEQITYLIAGSISQVGRVKVVPAEEVYRFYQSVVGETGSQTEQSNPLQEMVNSYKSGTAIVGTIFPLSESNFEIRINIRDMRTGDYLRNLEPIVGNLEHREELLERIHQEVMAALAGVFDPEFSSFVGHFSQPPSPEAFAAYRMGLQEYFQRHRVSAIQHFYHANEIDRNYLTPLVWAARVNSVMSTRASLAVKDSLVTILSPSLSQLTQFERFIVESAECYKDGCIDYSRSFEIAKKAARLAPGTFWSFDAGQDARINGLPHEALTYFDEVNPDATFIRNWSGWSNQVTSALSMVGKHEEAIELAREQRRRQPDSWVCYAIEVRQLAHMGKVEEILSLFEESKRLQPTTSYSSGMLLRSRAAPRLRGYGYRDEAKRVMEIALNWYENEGAEDTNRYRSSIANALYFLERWEEARVIYAELNRETGRYQQYLGWIAVHLGNVEEAHMWGRQLAAYTDTLTYQRYYSRKNQAKLAALLGDSEEAVQLLQQAINEGQDYTPMLPRELEFEGLSGYSSFNALFSYFPN